MSSPKVSPVNLQKVYKNHFQEQLDLLAVEEPLEIRIGYGPAGARQQKPLSVTMRTPGNDLELAAGFLFTEGIIQSMNDIHHIEHCLDAGRQEKRDNIVRVELQPFVKVNVKMLERHFYTTSSCGVCGKASIDAVRISNCPKIDKDQPVIDPAIIHELPERLRNQQTVFDRTGGLHAAALYNSQGEVLLVREDVGRHNAMDKLIGTALFKKMMPLSDNIILVSGRASFELIQKALMARTPILAAVGAPSSLAVELAKEFGMTLIGFVRNNGYNIYSGEWRLTAPVHGMTGEHQTEKRWPDTAGACK